MRVVQMEPGPCPTLMAFAPQSARIFHARRAGDVAGDDGQFRERLAQNLHGVAHALAVAVRGRDGHHVHAAFNQRADVVQNAFAVQFAERVARGRDRRAAEEMEMGVARRLELRVAFLRDALHVAHRDEALQMVVFIHHQQFVDADVFGEKFVGAGNRVLAQILFLDGMHLGARRQRFGNLLFGVTRLDDVAGKQADQPAFAIHDRKRAETEFFLLNQREHVADELVGRHFDGFLNQAVDVVFDAADFGKLLALRHVVMDQAEAAVQRHGDGHARFGHRVHVRRNNRDVQLQSFRQRRAELRVAREDFRIKRRQRDVVEGQAQFVVCGEKVFRRLVERVVKVGIARCCHVRKCGLTTAFGKTIFLVCGGMSLHARGARIVLNPQRFKS